MKLFKDILKQRGKYSQGRIYLLWSIIAYYVTLGILTWAGLNPKHEIELHKFEIILDALEYSMTLFGGYVFGGKFVDVIKNLKNNNKEDEETN